MLRNRKIASLPAALTAIAVIGACSPSGGSSSTSSQGGAWL